MSLRVRGVHVADFFCIEGLPPEPIRCRISGRGATWMKDPADERISPWHRAVLISWIEGSEICRYAD